MAPEKDEMSFEDAFAEEAGVATEISEDEAFGLSPDTGPADDAGAADDTAVAAVAGEDNEAAAASAKVAADEANAKAATKAGAESTATKEAGGDASATKADGPIEDAVEAAVGEELALAEEGDGPAVAAAEPVAAEGGAKAAMTEQQLRSWEGRLRKAEADLKTKADTTAAGSAEGSDVPGSTSADTAGEALDEVAGQVEADGDAEGADTIEAVAEQVKTGEITPAEAMQILSEDFGEQFVQMIELVARNAANTSVDEKIGPMGKSLEDVVGHLEEGAQRSHFEAIFAAHPDFVEVSENPAFQEFVQAQGAGDVVEGGKAAEINQLLASFKASKEVDAGDTPNGEPEVAAAAPVAAVEEPVVDDLAMEEEADAAEGVRSGGLRLPDEPKAGADDFEAAWNEA